MYRAIEKSDTRDLSFHTTSTEVAHLPGIMAVDVAVLSLLYAFWTIQDHYRCCNRCPFRYYVLQKLPLYRNQVKIIPYY